MIEIWCEKCSKIFSVWENHIWKKWKCPTCWYIFSIMQKDEDKWKSQFLITQEFSVSEQRYIIESYAAWNIKKIYLAVRDKDIIGGILISVLSFIWWFISFILSTGIIMPLTSSPNAFLFALTIIIWVLVTCILFILFRPKRHCYLYSHNDIFGTDENPERANLEIREIYSAFGNKKYVLIERWEELATIYKKNLWKSWKLWTWRVEMWGKVVIDADNGSIAWIMSLLFPISLGLMAHELQSFKIYHTESAELVWSLVFGSPQRDFKELWIKRLAGDKYMLNLSKKTNNINIQKILFWLSILLDYWERR